MQRPARLLAACAAVVLLFAGCGPNALPRPTPADSADGNQPAPIQPAAAPAAPMAQLFGGSQPAGRILFIKDWNLWIWENGNARQLASGDTWQQPRWAPDASQFAYVYQAGNFSDVFVSDPAGQNQMRLTRSQSTVLDDNDWNFHPTWSPDGKQLAYLSDVDTFFPVLWTMNVDGTGPRKVPVSGLSAESVDTLDWSPDGTQIAATINDGRNPSQVALIPVGGTAGKQSRVLTDQAAGAMDPAWSPDGSWLAFAAREGRTIDIYAMHPDGSGVQRLTNTGMARAPSWSPDGHTLAYLSAQSGAFELWTVDLSAGASGALEAKNPRQLTHDLSIDATSGLSWGR